LRLRRRHEIEQRPARKDDEQQLGHGARLRLEK
jgi:hypothetical protein